MSDCQKTWLVEAIVDRRINDNKEPEYYVKWKDFPPEENSWEPLKNLTQCKAMIEDFEIQRKKEQTVSPPRTRSGFERNQTADAILAASHKDGKLKFLLIKWKETEEPDLVPLEIVRKHNPQVSL